MTGQFVLESILVKGHIRDKFELIKIAASEAKKRFRVEGNVTVIKAWDYDSEIVGHICVVEFVRKPLLLEEGSMNAR